ncbi:unnamed protein product, partial [Mesorhabditis spiculigera]
MATQDWVAIAIMGGVGTLALCMNAVAGKTIWKNTSLSITVKTYLCAEHTLRIVMSIMAYYVVAQSIIRFDAPDPLSNITGVSYGFRADAYDQTKTYEDFYYASPVTEQRTLDEMGDQHEFWAQDLNRLCAFYFVVCQFAVDYLQLGLSVNRVAGVVARGKYLKLTSKNPVAQVMLFISIPFQQLYKPLYYQSLVFDKYEHNLYRGSMPSAINIGYSYEKDVWKNAAHWNELTLMRHLKILRNSTGLSVRAKESRADFRLAQQIFFNNFFTFLVCLATAEYLYFIDNAIDTIIKSAFSGPNDGFGVKTIMRSFGSKVTGDWLIIASSLYFPTFGNLVAGCITWHFLRPRVTKLKQKTEKSNAASTIQVETMTTRRRTTTNAR